MRLLVINLERERDRRAKMRERFAALGLDIEIFPAVDGRTLTAEQRAIVDNVEDRRRHLSVAMGDGSIGCLWSHLSVWRLCADGPDDLLAVFEDDVALSPRLPEALAAIERLGPRFDFVRLHHVRQPLRVAPCADIGGFLLGRPRFHDVGTLGYVVSRAGARRTLALMTEWPLEVDIQLGRWWDHGLDYFSIDPPVVSHDDGGYSSRSHLDGTESARLPGAHGPIHWMRRRFARILDSYAKRRRFAAWVADGRRRLTDSQDR